MNKHILYILIIYFPFTLYAQYEETPFDYYKNEAIQQHKFDETRWSDMVSDVDFTEQFTENKLRKRDTERANNGVEGRDYERPREQNRRPWIYSFENGSWFLKGLLILLAVVGLVFLLRALIRADLKTKNKKINTVASTNIDIDKIEEQLDKADLNHFIGQAVGSGEYGLAIRLYYLSVLKTLAERKAIKWKKDKTNRQYLSELKGSKHYHIFKEITSIFELIWYGNRGISATKFAQLEPKFKDLIHELKSK